MSRRSPYTIVVLALVPALCAQVHKLHVVRRMSIPLAWSAVMDRSVRTMVVVALIATACASTAADPTGRASEAAVASAAVASQIAEPMPFPLDATIPELQAALDTDEFTSVELVEFYLARIAAYDDAGPELNALIHVNPAARDEAAALDAERAASGPRGLMHGIPVVVKDNINTADMPTTGGALALDGFQPAADAFQITRLREAGAIVIAKANLAELAHGWNSASEVGGQTLNPYDLTRDPGGSSGGTAVAVTANFAAVGLGTDTCGSIRLPAGHSNLYGLRPTSGLSSRAGVIPFSSTLDTVGPMARNVVDLAIVLDVTAGADPADPTTVPNDTSFVEAVDANGLKGRRIGVRSFSLSAELESTMQAAIDEMEAHGAEIVEVTLPLEDYGFQEFFTETRFALEDYLASEPTAPLGALAEMMALDPEAANVATLDTELYRGALAGQEPFRRDVVAAMDALDLDAVAYPVSPGTAARIGGSQAHFDCSTAAMAGAPAIVLPAGFSSDGLPVGIELLGRPFNEATLIAIAAGYEAHTSHRTHPLTAPPLDR